MPPHPHTLQELNLRIVSEGDLRKEEAVVQLEAQIVLAERAAAAKRQRSEVCAAAMMTLRNGLDHLLDLSGRLRGPASNSEQRLRKQKLARDESPNSANRTAWGSQELLLRMVDDLSEQLGAALAGRSIARMVARLASSRCLDDLDDLII